MSASGPTYKRPQDSLPSLLLFFFFFFPPCPVHFALLLTPSLLYTDLHTRWLLLTLTVTLAISCSLHLLLTGETIKLRRDVFILFIAGFAGFAVWGRLAARYVLLCVSLPPNLLPSTMTTYPFYLFALPFPDLQPSRSTLPSFLYNPTIHFPFFRLYTR